MTCGSSFFNFLSIYYIVCMNYSILSRSYDLRWVYPTEINEDFYNHLGYAFALWSKASRIALGHDARLSGKSLSEAFAQWANRAGATIIDIWFCSSDMLSFATCFSCDIEVGVMITASHNPKDQNGMKSVWHSGEPINLKHVGNEIIALMNLDDGMVSHNTHWGIELRDVTEDWTSRIMSFTETQDFSSLKIVADGGNWAAWAYMTKIAERAWFNMIPLFLEADGNFPNHHPNPMLRENREHAKNTILESNADLGLLFDGDADRVVILDSRWEMIVSWVICSVIAHALLEKHPWKTIAGNAVISHSLQASVEKYGWKYIRTRVDSVAIKAMMLSNPEIIFAWEHSTHYFFQSNWCTDSGIIAAFVFLDILLRSWLSLDELIAKYTQFVTLEEQNFIVRDRNEVIDTLSQLYAGESHDFLDWLTVSYDDGSWWNVRPASNDPVIRLNMEAKTQERYDELYLEIREQLAHFS